MPTIKTIYIDTGATGGANGTSWTHAYPSLRLALSGEGGATPNVLTSNNLVTSDEIAKFLVNASTSAAETTSTVFSAPTEFTTNNTNYLWIIAEGNQRANTIWSTSKYRLSYTGAGTLIGLPRDVILEGIQIEASSSAASLLNLTSGGNGTKRDIIGCYIRKTSATSGGNAIQINNSNRDTKIVNCILTGWNNGIKGLISRTDLTKTSRIYNCTFANNNIGVNYDGFSPGDTVLKNCIFANSAIAVANGQYEYGTNYNSTNSPSFGGSFSVYGGDNINDKVNQQFTFINGYALSSADTGARGGGANLSSDSIASVTTDIDNKTRTGVWDIGAYNINESAYVLTVDDDRTVSANQQNVLANGAGLSGQTSFIIFSGFGSGTKNISCSIDSTSASSITLDIPSLSSILAANIAFGKIFYKVSTLPVIQGTLDPPIGYGVHNVTDISQSGNTYCIYNGQSPSIAVGDQILYNNSLYVDINSQGFPTLSNNQTSFSYYIYDPTDETWGTVGIYSASSNSAEFIFQAEQFVETGITQLVVNTDETAFGMSANLKYVSLTGNDSSTTPNNPNTPWLTIEKGVYNLNANDTLLIRGGTYRIDYLLHLRGTFYSQTYGGNPSATVNSQTGTASQPITVRNYPGERVIIDCANTVGVPAGGTTNNMFIMLENKQYWRFHGLEFANTSMAFELGTNVNSTNNTIQWCTINQKYGGDNWGAIVLNGGVLSDSTTIQYNTFNGPGSNASGIHLNTGNIVAFRVGKLTIKNNIMSNTPCGIYFKHANNPNVSNTNIIISGNYIKDTDRFASFFNTNYANITNNIFASNSNLIINESNGVAGGDYNDIGYNTIANNLVLLWATDPDDPPAANGAIGNIVKNNIIRGITEIHRYNATAHFTTTNYNAYGDVIWNNSISYTLPAWKTFYGQDANSVNGAIVFSGGTYPSSISGYKLDPTSIGVSAAENGADMGANTANVGVPSTISIPSSAVMRIFANGTIYVGEMNELALTPSLRLFANGAVQAAEFIEVLPD